MDQVVRRSLARVSFKWRNTDHPDKQEKRTQIDMVIPGVIVSVKDGNCLLICDSSFFRDKSRFTFHVALPEEGGIYGESIYMVPKKRGYINHRHFYGFSVKTNNYVAAVTFETSPIRQTDILYTFLFARETVISEACSAGHKVDYRSQNDVEVLFHDCALHDYGHFGAPVFNKNGFLLGICYATQSRTHAWTVHFLKKLFDKLLKDWSVTYVCSNEDPSQRGASSSDASNNPPPPSSCLGRDMDPGDVPHLGKRSRLDVSGSSSASVHHAPAPPLPSGVVTLGYKKNRTTQMIYTTGIIIACEKGEGNQHTTLVFSRHMPRHDKVYAYFEPSRRTEAEVCSIMLRHMIVSVKGEFHEPLTWSNRTDPRSEYQLVKSIGIMAGTKLNDTASGPIQSLVGVLALYHGQITTPRCHAATVSSRTILSGTEKYFQFSCSYQDALFNFSNLDLERVTYECDSVMSAPVFSLNGEFVGIIVSCGNWPDTKTGMYSEWVLPIIENLMMHFRKGWSKDMLKWSSAHPAHT